VIVAISNSCSCLAIVKIPLLQSPLYGVVAGTACGMLAANARHPLHHHRLAARDRRRIHLARYTQLVLTGNAMGSYLQFITRKLSLATDRNGSRSDLYRRPRVFVLNVPCREGHQALPGQIRSSAPAIAFHIAAVTPASSSIVANVDMIPEDRLSAAGSTRWRKA
jgi:hypothetical protein